MPGRNQLGELERAVIEQLWSGAEWQTVREVHDALTATREIAYTTVMTVLERMERKALVTRERAGRAWRYRAAQTRGELTAEAMRAALGEFAEDDRQAALVAFVGEVSAADRAALRAALESLG